ncbi:hypothetical protein DSECCO2_534680 [anaerobic digester metagenome]
MLIWYSELLSEAQIFAITFPRILKPVSVVPTLLRMIVATVLSFGPINTLFVSGLIVSLSFETFMFSTYVPGFIKITSPASATSTASCIVEICPLPLPTIISLADTVDGIPIRNTKVKTISRVLPFTLSPPHRFYFSKLKLK